MTIVQPSSDTPQPSKMEPVSSLSASCSGGLMASANTSKLRKATCRSAGSSTYTVPSTARKSTLPKGPVRIW